MLDIHTGYNHFRGNQLTEFTVSTIRKVVKHIKNSKDYQVTSIDTSLFSDLRMLASNNQKFRIGLNNAIVHRTEYNNQSVELNFHVIKGIKVGHNNYAIQKYLCYNQKLESLICAAKVRLLEEI